MVNPDSLADEEEFDDEEWFYEGYEYAVSDGLKISVGLPLPQDATCPAEPSGTDLDENPDSLKKLYPKLWKRFPRIDEAPTPSQELVKHKAWWKFWG